jgi:hypothetical protein
VIAFRREVWREFAPSAALTMTKPFFGIAGPEGHGAPATPHDFWIWISGSTPDLTWEHARAVVLAVSDVTLLAAEQARGSPSSTAAT